MKKPQAKKPASRPKAKPEPSMAEVAAAQPKTQAARERKYQVEDALRTLQRAEEIKADPKLMADVHAHGHQQIAAIKKVTGRHPPGRSPSRAQRKAMPA
jgi:hypothetical protein